MIQSIETIDCVHCKSFSDHLLLWDLGKYEAVCIDCGTLQDEIDLPCFSFEEYDLDRVNDTLSKAERMGRK